MIQAKKSIAIENTHVAKGSLPQEQGPDELAYKARLAEADARKAEALALVHPDMDVFQKIRTFLMRGELSLVESILKSVEFSTLSLETQAELYLEAARLAMMKGLWQEAVQLGQQSLNAGPGGVTRLTLHQVRANAFFELGDFASADRELQTANSLLKLYPKGPIGLYILATEIKIAASLGLIDKAKTKLESAWEKLNSSDRNLDLILVLQRSELEIRRREGKPSADLAASTWLLSKATGDQVYESLCLVEFYYSLPIEKREPLKEELLKLNSKYERSFKLTHEIENGAICLSAQSIVATKVDSDFNFELHKISELNQVLIPKRGLRLQLDTLQITEIDFSAKIVAALKSLSVGEISREKFFIEVWGMSKYVPHLHEEGVRSLLSRVRKACGLELKTKQNQILVSRYLLVVE